MYEKQVKKTFSLRVASLPTPLNVGGIEAVGKWFTLQTEDKGDCSRVLINFIVVWGWLSAGFVDVVCLPNVHYQ